MSSRQDCTTNPNATNLVHGWTNDLLGGIVPPDVFMGCEGRDVRAVRTAPSGKREPSLERRVWFNSEEGESR